MSYRSGMFPSGINAPAIRPTRVAMPGYTCWHVVIFDITDRDDPGFVIDTMRHRDQAVTRVQGRANTIRREGYEKSPVIEGQSYMLTKPGECYLVTIQGCRCNAKTVEDLSHGASHVPPLPSREKGV